MTERGGIDTKDEYVKPQEEPVYVPRSDKNTYFVEQVDNRLDNTINDPYN